MPNVIFTQPHFVNAALAEQCGPRTIVLDIAFNAGRNNPAQEFNDTTLAFIQALGPRLVAWVDHHDHDEWPEFHSDPRFVLVPRSDAPACPPILTSVLVAKFGTDVDTIICHGDLDGILSACFWMHGGNEPYDGALADSVAADSRVGTVGPMGSLIENAIKSDPRDDSIRQDVVSWLVYQDEQAEQHVKSAAENYAETERITKEVAVQYQIIDKVAFVDARKCVERFDRTALLLAGQRMAQVAIVRYISRYIDPKSGQEVSTDMIVVAAPRPWNFKEMFHLSGGAINVVNIPATRLDEAIELINR